MTTPNIRAVLERLVNAVDVYDAVGMDMMDDAIAAARAALATEPEPPVKGEVGELVRWLLAHADEHTEEPDGPYTRAATLLQQLAAPAPAAEESSATQPDDLALRVQRLEAMRETERAAVLDLYQQIDKLQQRIDWQYVKLGRLEDAITSESDPA